MKSSNSSHIKKERRGLVSHMANYQIMSIILMYHILKKYRAIGSIIYIMGNQSNVPERYVARISLRLRHIRLVAPYWGGVESGIYEFTCETVLFVLHHLVSFSVFVQNNDFEIRLDPTMVEAIGWLGKITSNLKRSTYAVVSLYINLSSEHDNFY